MHILLVQDLGKLPDTNGMSKEACIVAYRLSFLKGVLTKTDTGKADLANLINRVGTPSDESASSRISCLSEG